MKKTMAATAVTLNDLEGHSPVADLFKCNPFNICAAFIRFELTVCSRGSSALAELLVKLTSISHTRCQVRTHPLSGKYIIYCDFSVIYA